MGSFAADHLIVDGPRFVEVVREAVGRRRAGPADDDRHHADPAGDRLRLPADAAPLLGDGTVRRVEEFKEKPAYDVARRYVESGGYLWNAGMFVWRVDVFLAELARQQPALHAGLTAIAAAWDDPAPRRGARRDLADAAEDLRRLRGDGGRGRGRPGRHRARRLRLDRRRRLPHARRRAAARRRRQRGGRGGRRRSQAAGAAARHDRAASWCRSPAAWSPRSACAT